MNGIWLEHWISISKNRPREHEFMSYIVYIYMKYTIHSRTLEHYREERDVMVDYNFLIAYCGHRHLTTFYVKLVYISAENWKRNHLALISISRPHARTHTLAHSLTHSLARSKDVMQNCPKDSKLWKFTAKYINSSLVYWTNSELPQRDERAHENTNSIAFHNQQMVRKLVKSTFFDLICMTLHLFLPWKMFPFLVKGPNFKYK